uniref:Uncharacterized protein n=1 Tax=Sipha flava TaxID=143950 RepID=A0A2S2Q854_9HEMI
MRRQTNHYFFFLHFQRPHTKNIILKHLKKGLGKFNPSHPFLIYAGYWVFLGTLNRSRYLGHHPLVPRVLEFSKQTFELSLRDVTSCVFNLVSCFVFRFDFVCLLFYTF